MYPIFTSCTLFSGPVLYPLGNPVLHLALGCFMLPVASHVAHPVGVAISRWSPVLYKVTGQE